MKTRETCHVSQLAAEVGSLPAVAAQIVHLACDPDCEVGVLAKVILSDNVMAMRFLALANSAALSRGREIRDLRGALVRLGLRRVRNVAFLMGMHDLAPAAGPQAGLDMADFWKHTLAVASCAQGLARSGGRASFEDAWLVGILHGIGLPALAQKAPDRFSRSVAVAREKKVSLTEAELQVAGFHHGELGARILADWNLPRVFVQTAEFWPEDYTPGEVDPEADQLITLLRRAMVLVRSTGFGDNGDGDPRPTPEQAAALLGLDGPELAELTAMIDREVRQMSQLAGMDLQGESLTEALQRSSRMAAEVGFQGLEDSLANDDLEAELETAREIQRGLLPKMPPQISNFEVAAFNRPCSHVSGDHYDFLPFPAGRIGFLIADICGSGLPAALLASNLQASIRALAGIFPDPGRLLAAANEALFESTDPERFATIFLAVLDPDTGTLEYASAGHNPPLLLRADRSAHWLRPDGPPLGMWAEAAFPVHTIGLQPGDLLVAYTDGLTEAADHRRDEYGTVRLAETAAADLSRTPVQLIAAILESVGEHSAVPAAPAGSQGFPADDLTLLVLKRSS